LLFQLVLFLLEKHLSSKEMEEVKAALAESIKRIEKNYKSDSLITNKKDETWMDTDMDNQDPRDGARIEVQALHLNMLRLMSELSNEKKYKNRENKMKKAVIERFWNGETLADGDGDFTARPNVFIAHYVYPDLLSRPEWQTCFENILKKLWLDWGGLASIDPKHRLFVPDYTGIDNKSYHRGDSWFWINNLAALCMFRNNPIYFEEKILKIIESSTKELLWHGAVGHAAEISSASHLSSKGCFAQAWSAASSETPADTTWVTELILRADRIIALYGDPNCIDYARLQDSVQREQLRLSLAEEQAHQLRLQTIRPIYRQLYPQRYLESIRGVGQDSAAIYIAFIGDILRFPTLRNFRGWSGLIPYSRQSANAQARGLHITKAGPNLIKATAFLDAQVARLWDPQIAAIYHKQMMVLGKHYLQAICACATHLLDRIYVVLKENRPYELRDVDGTPVDKHTARRICQEHYQVPDVVRRRNNHRVRKARQEKQLEKHHKQR